ncbi:MAG: hypothetical protein ACKVOJ_09170 [Sphingomonadaceae bacterium]
MSDRAPSWLDRRSTIAALVLMSVVPLLWPTTPPLTDLPGHMGRYAVQLGLAGGEWYSFKWALVGNLGVDIFVQLFGPLIGLEIAVKVIVIATVAMTTLGMLLLAKQIHGRVPQTALFALPFVYSYPFHYGFVNFSLSVGFAFLAFALWVRLADQERLRALIFVPLASIVWVAHVYGWGVLGVLAFAFEARRGGQKLWRAMLGCLPLTVPFLLMIMSQQSEGVGFTGDWLNVSRKTIAIFSVLRDRWQWFDLGSLVVLSVVIFLPVRSKSDKALALAAILFTLLFIAMPTTLIGSTFADSRMLPILFAIAILSIKPSQMQWIGLVALAFFGVRTVGTTISYWQYDQSYKHELAALAHIPPRARLVSLVRVNCMPRWAEHRLEHLPGLALVRRGAFSNDQWNQPGAQLARTHYPQGAPFDRDPSQFVIAGKHCQPGYRLFSDALQTIPRAAFDYIWVINAPPDPLADYRGLTPLWKSGNSGVYRINR